MENANLYIYAMQITLSRRESLNILTPEHPERSNIQTS